MIYIAFLFYCGFGSVAEPGIKVGRGRGMNEIMDQWFSRQNPDIQVKYKKLHKPYLCVISQLYGFLILLTVPFLMVLDVHLEFGTTLLINEAILVRTMASEIYKPNRALFPIHLGRLHESFLVIPHFRSITCFICAVKCNDTVSFSITYHVNLGFLNIVFVNTNLIVRPYDCIYRFSLYPTKAHQICFPPSYIH